MSTVIKVENLSKRYRLGEIGTGTFAHDINRYWHKLRGKEDPYSTIGGQGNSISQKYFWPLQNISFDIERGTAVAVVGRNGAGKSTLLKILSRITAPTKGTIKVKGRIASLLEVGTGFHQELSGKENIYLNGAILGMTRREITSKFDQIVEFAGVEKYIDTPVKRYSSGMYVRLAFAVAAHLDADILIVDEVLAVGDAEFQKKCLGKMGEVTNEEGRTILFVSHNMASAKRLCKYGLFLKDGGLIMNDEMTKVAETYLQMGITTDREISWPQGDEPGNDKIKIKKVKAFGKGKEPSDPITTNDDIFVQIDFVNQMYNTAVDVSWDVFDAENVHLFHSGTLIENGEKINEGNYSVIFKIPANILNNKRYHFNVNFGMDRRFVAYKQENILTIDVENEYGAGLTLHSYAGVIHPKIDWILDKQ